MVAATVAWLRCCIGGVAGQGHRGERARVGAAGFHGEGAARVKGREGRAGGEFLVVSLLPFAVDFEVVFAPLGGRGQGMEI